MKRNDDPDQAATTASAAHLVANQAESLAERHWTTVPIPLFELSHFAQPKQCLLSLWL